MTDSSDSEVSLDDDYCQYNVSASELWDGFWPSTEETNAREWPGSSITQPSRSTQEYFSVDVIKQYADDAEDDTVTITPLEDKAECAKQTQRPRDSRQSSPRRASSKRGPPRYSVYPKQQQLSPPRLPHPPRTSSLRSGPPDPSRHRSLKGSKSSFNLSPLSMLTHRLHVSPPSFAKPASQPTTAKSVPVSPAYPSPPPKSLRPSVSAFNLREFSSSSEARHNTTAPLPQLVQRMALPESPFPPRPAAAERFVSVFDFDSDAESVVGPTGAHARGGRSNHSNGSFAKFIARGLHKKSASEKQRGPSTSSSSMSQAVAPLDFAVANHADGEGSEKDRGKKRPSRKRGGSLGRILGFKGR
ncbi:hypothetical protein DL762_003189 [Monosporascus cannonballus]|uniref:Uncharacterized protein n=1 Tax=Monosporascus cannonballus TaxID=155416 RepID=A0ABY0HEA0_9PEZI|nr:hypothetical protein DL762_003189 [Monosporascus cannonballus]